MEVNPWNVKSLEEFQFYNCPECDDKYSTRQQFVGHAMIMHPKACEILPGILHELNSELQRMEVVNNPWNVTSLEEFHFYNCQECEEKYLTRQQFVGHAMIMHPKACEILPGILHGHGQSVVKPESCDNLVISNVQSVSDVEPESCDDESCDDERVESVSTVEIDENCFTSDIELSSKTSLNEALERAMSIEKVFQFFQFCQFFSNFSIFSISFISNPFISG